MMRNSPVGREPGIQSAHRVLQLIRLMTARGVLSVTDAADELGVHPSSAQRLLATLLADGFAVQDDRRRYLAGPELLRAGQMTTAASMPVKMRPTLERLYTRVRETVHLVTMIGTTIQHIDGIQDTSHALRFGGRIGVTLPAHVTSSGRALLAELSRAEMDRRYLSDPGNTAGVRGLGDMTPLYRMAAATRREGMGMNFGDSEPGVAAFGMSVGLVDGQRVALSIAMPSARFTKDLIPHFRAHLEATVTEFKTTRSTQSTTTPDSSSPESAP